MIDKTPSHESKEYETPFLPKIWRDKGVDRTPLIENTMFTLGELKVLQSCQESLLNNKIFDPYFIKFISSPTKPINIKNENLLHWATLAQHYGYPTRLVDISSGDARFAH